MQFVKILCTTLLLGCPYAFPNNQYSSSGIRERDLNDSSDYMQIGNLGGLDLEDEGFSSEEEEADYEMEADEAFIDTDSDLWLRYFARNNLGRYLVENGADGERLQYWTGWVREQLPQIDGLALIVGGEAFIRAYNLILEQEGRDAYSLAAAQRCLEDMYAELIQWRRAPMMRWLVSALFIVRNRQAFAAGPNCI